MENILSLYRPQLSLKALPCDSKHYCSPTHGNGKCKVTDKKHALSVKQECSKTCSFPSADGFLSFPFSIKERTVAINQVKSGKAQGPDNIPPEFLKYSGSKCLAWLKNFLQSLCPNKIYQRSGEKRP